MSFLNQYLWKEKIKFDDWKVFEDFIDSDSRAYLFKFVVIITLTFTGIIKNFWGFLGVLEMDLKDIFYIQFYLLA